MPHILTASAAVLVCTLSAPGAAAPAKAAPSSEQKTKLKVIDQEIARFDALTATIMDRGEKASVHAFLDGFKDRREALRTAFNHDTYLELRWEIDVEYQRLVAWLAPPSIP
jgi:hypothetical protein